MTCKDCIHRDVCSFKEDLIEIEAEQYNYIKEIDKVEKLCRDFKNRVDWQEVKHAKWIKSPRFFGGYNYKCSECGEWALGDIDDYEVIASAYCPHCGARMDGDTE